MTPSEMLTLLGYRLEDPNGDVYTTALKVLMINRAQARVYTELNPHVVPELRSKESDLALDEYGAFGSSDLTSTILGGISGGVFDVQDATNEYFTGLLSFDEYRMATDRKVTYSSQSPRRYIYGNEQFYLPFTTPTAMANTTEFVSGNYYYIKTWQTGDDFSNVGGSNDGVTNMRFKATASGAATTFTTSVVYLTSGVNVYYKKQPLQVISATSGSLVSGTEYTITDFVSGDDFSNVGATSNASGITFTATGTTPTTWTNGSRLVTNTAFTVESELVHDAIAYFSESLCWHINRDEREAQAIEQASALIQTLNESTPATDSNMRDDEYLDDNYNPIEPISDWEI